MLNEYCQYLLDLDGDRGDEAHGQWGTWAMGPMGDWHILAYQLNLNHLCPHRAIFSCSELDRLTPSCQILGQNFEYPSL